MRNWLVSLPRNVKRFVMVACDLVLLPLAMWLAFAIRLDEWAPGELARYWWLLPAAPAVSIPFFIRLGLYRAVVRYMGAQVALTVLYGAALSALALAAVTLMSGSQGVPRSVFVIYGLLALMFVGGSRLAVRGYVRGAGVRQRRERVAIYGAGSAGVQLANALRGGAEFQPVALLDDNPALWGSTFNGLKVYDPHLLEKLIERKRISQVLLAMPSVSRARRHEILAQLEQFPVHVRTMPALSDLVSGRASVDDIREVEVDDLLGRDSVPPYPELVDACIRGKSVMITGAGGSIGSELTRQILRLRPSRLVLLEVSEYALYKIDQEVRSAIQKEGLAVDYVPLLGTVQDYQKLRQVMATFRVQTVYHAAAYKHVPTVEHNVIEGVRNNVFGTLCTAKAAIAARVETMVLISTDKAVRPTNVMGTSKRLAELILQGLSQSGRGTRFCMVRFGNVLGSSGSVVPLFRKQIRKGGPVTVTHPDVTRFFMTIREAAELVLQASSMGQGGDVFVLDMGSPVRILELAKLMIRLSGLEVRDEQNPDGDIAIEITGLRPGEKLYEELIIGDNVSATSHPRIMSAMEQVIPWGELAIVLERLEQACHRYDLKKVRSLLLQTVQGYRPKGDIEDLLWAAAAKEASRYIEVAPPEAGTIVQH